MPVLDKNDNGLGDPYSAHNTRRREEEATDLAAQQARSDREFDGIVDNIGENADSGTENRNIDRARGVRAQNKNSFMYEPPVNPPSETPKPSRFSFKARIRKKAAAAAATVILGSGIAVIPIIGGNLAPLMLVESLTKDLSDKIPAYQMRGKQMSISRLRPTISSSEAVKGCTTLSIRCKFKTIGPKQQARYAKSGIEVRGKQVAGGFLVPEEYKFRSKTYTPAEYERALRTNGNLSQAHYRSNNAKYFAYQGSFVNRVLVRYGLAKKPKSGTTGSKKDRINQLLTSASVENTSDLKFIPATDADGNEIEGKYHMADGEGNIVGDKERTFSQKERDKIQPQIDGAKSPKPPSVGVKSMAGALGIIGAADLACSINNMLGAGNIAAKIAAKEDTVTFSWELFATIHKIMYGDGTAEDAEVIGSFLNDTDGRKQIADIAATAAAVQADGDFEGEVLMDNPNYGKSGMDSELLKMSINGGVAPITATQKHFSVGYDAGTLLNGLDVAASTTDAIVNFAGEGRCALVQNWMVRGTSLLAAGILAFFSGGGSLAVQLSITGGLIAAMWVLQEAINASVSGSVTDILADGEEKVGRVDAAWTGMAEIQSTASQTVGMIPANASEMADYQNGPVREAYLDTARYERSIASPYDIRNQYTLLGSLSRSIVSKTGFSPTPTSLIASLPTIVSSSLIPKSGAYDNSYARYQRCKNKDFIDIGIQPDVQCNVRYYMPSQLLEKNPETVAAWMEDNGYVDKDTTTGLPAGYTPPNLREGENALQAFLYGSTVGIFKSNDDLVNDYGRFLEFCALRVAPYGDTFQEAGLIGGAGSRDWITGKKCRERSEAMDNFRVYTMDVAFVEDEEYEPSDESTSAATEDIESLSVGSYNLLHEYNPQTGKSCRQLGLRGANCTRERSKIQTGVIKGEGGLGNPKLSIIGTQETGPNQISQLVSGTGYESFPKPDKMPRARGRSILWDSSQLSLVDSGFLEGTYDNVGDPTDDLDPWVELETTNKQKVFITSIHSPRNGYPNADQRRDDNARVVTRWAEGKIRGDNIVIITGDFNDGPDTSAQKIIMNSGKIKHASGAPSSRPTPIDKIFIHVPDSIKVSGWKRVSKELRKTGTDHSPAWVSLGLPSSGGELKFPVDQKYWDQDSSLFLKRHTGAGTFTSPNKDGISADISLPKGTPVYAMAAGKVIKRPLGRSSRICQGNPNGNDNGGLMVESTVNGKKLQIAYAHGYDVTSKDSVEKGEPIMKIGEVGNACGPHLHIDMSYDNKNICPQDVFRAINSKYTLDFEDLVRKVTPQCSGIGT